MRIPPGAAAVEAREETPQETLGETPQETPELRQAGETILERMTRRDLEILVNRRMMEMLKQGKGATIFLSNRPDLTPKTRPPKSPRFLGRQTMTGTKILSDSET
jgi:hypothetical protein